MSEDIRSILPDIAALATYTGPIERLGGLTNRVYRLGAHVLRLPGAGTAEYIHRGHEALSAQAAARAGVGPQVVHVDPASGIMVTQHIDRAVTMTAQGFRDRPGAVARAGAAFRALHRSGETFPFRFELFAMIDDYLALLATKDVALPAGYHAVLADTAAIRAALALAPAPLAPCHCDPLCENLLDTGDKVWIVDWEYAGMNDPMWDLGDLSVEGQFDAAQDRALLTSYFDGPPGAADHGRMVIYKAMCDLLWTLWGLIQLANANPADDFRSYADNRFARCRALMGTPAFGQHLAAITA